MKILTTIALLIAATPVAAQTDAEHADTILQARRESLEMILRGEAAPYYFAQQSNQTTVRDARGRTIGTATTDSDGTTTFRDARGRIIGSATTDSSGTTAFREASGRTTGTTSPARR